MTRQSYRFRRSFWLLMAGTVGYACALFWATHAPDLRPPVIGPPGVPSDKIFHFLGYTVLAFLAILTVMTRRTRRITAIVAILVLIVVAGIDEATQPLTRRDAEFADWCADVTGIFVGAIVSLRLFEILGRPSG
jgi:VanZ family protein